MRVAAIALAVTMGLGFAPRQDPRASLSVMEALELYELGDPEVTKLVATPRQIGSIETELIKNAGAWIRANGSKEAPRRWLVAATFALEAARHGLENTDGGSTWRLMNWASDELQADRTPLPGERLWRMASLSLFADWLAHFPVELTLHKAARGQNILTVFEQHLGAAERRFPGDPRWVMDRAYIAELFAAQPHLRQPPLGDAIQIPNNAIRPYESVLEAPAVRAEAHVRLAYLRLLEGDADRAISHATDAASQSREPDLAYVAHLIRGWALTRLGRNADALAAFRAAHAADENGQTAVLWLANRLFLDGQRAEAVSLLDRNLEAARDSDPWHLYYRGPFRMWPSLIRQLREANR